jgi:ubiquinone/menaquinone biosynthesis C-methylase UbiE
MEQGTRDTRKWFADWANDYDTTLGKVQRHHAMLDLVVSVSGVLDGDQVLDIGCGTGLLSLKFLEKAACSITAIDSSDEMLRIFREKIVMFNLSDQIHCEHQSAEEMDIHAYQFDIIASTVALHHVKEKVPVIHKVYESLKEGGRFVLGDMDLDTTGSIDDPGRLERILAFLTREYVLAMEDGGIPAFKRMYDNGRKHILNDGEYCIGFDQWMALCRGAGFWQVEVTPVKGFEWFKVLVARK